MLYKKDKTIAAFLGLFLGVLGGHRFYLGQNSMGVGYVLATCTFVGAFVIFMISIIDFIGFLAMPQDEFDRRYNPYKVIDKAWHSLAQKK